MHIAKQRVILKTVLVNLIRERVLIYLCLSTIRPLSLMTCRNISKRQRSAALLHYVPDLYRKMLFTTLWNTCARINETLARRMRKHFGLYESPLARGEWSVVHAMPRVRKQAVRDFITDNREAKMVDVEL